MTGHDRRLEGARTTRGQRLVLGAQARRLGHGGMELVGYLAGQLKSTDPDRAA